MSFAHRRVASIFVLGALAGSYAGCTTDPSNPEPEGDAGTHDAGVDTAVPGKDAAISADGNVVDSNVPDAEIGDTSRPDTSVPDGGHGDASVDAAADSAADASAPDSGAADASVQDTGISDTNAPDTDIPDSGAPDTNVPDAASDASFPTTANLLLNGDAESGAGASTAVVVPAPSWITGGNATVLLYGASGGYPLSTDPGPSDRGLNFFSGGPSDAVSTLTQHVDLAAYVYAIAQGQVTITLSGYFGGYSSQDDNAVLSVTYLDDTSTSLGSKAVGPVLAADRNSATGLLFETVTAPVPAGTVSIDAVLTLTRVSGTANDGYADNLSIVLTGN